MRSSLVVILAGLVLFHPGDEVFRSVLFPLAFLFFMVPMPGVIFYAVTFPLQDLAARQAAWTLDTLGVPVLLDGNIIHLAQRCSVWSRNCLRPATSSRSPIYRRGTSTRPNRSFERP